MRTGTGTASDDEDDEDDDRGTGRRAIDDDIDCLESDEDEDDDARRMRRLRASVGRCRAARAEDDFDAADAAAMGDDARAVMRGAFERTGRIELARGAASPGASGEVHATIWATTPTVTPRATTELAGEEPSRNARDERPNTPNARAETSSRDATPRPRFRERRRPRRGDRAVAKKTRLRAARRLSRERRRGRDARRGRRRERCRALRPAISTPASFPSEVMHRT